MKIGDIAFTVIIIGTGTLYFISLTSLNAKIKKYKNLNFFFFAVKVTVLSYMAFYHFSMLFYDSFKTSYRNPILHFMYTVKSKLRNIPKCFTFAL